MFGDILYMKMTPGDESHHHNFISVCLSVSFLIQSIGFNDV